MKSTKKLLKHTFGNKKDGLRFIQGLMEADPASPTLFIYPSENREDAENFAKWLFELTGNGAWISEEQFYKSEGFDESDSTIFVSGVSDVTDPFLMKLLKTRSPQHRVVVACQKYPKSLRYVRDPSMMLAEVPPFEVEELRQEIGDVVRKLS